LVFLKIKDKPIEGKKELFIQRGLKFPKDS